MDEGMSLIIEIIKEKLGKEPGKEIYYHYIATEVPGWSIPSDERRGELPSCVEEGVLNNTYGEAYFCKKGCHIVYYWQNNNGCPIGEDFEREFMVFEHTR